MSFDLDEQDLNEILKASRILQVSDVKIIANGGEIRIVVDDTANDTSNSFSVVVDENYSGPDYSGTFKVSEIKFLPGSYRVDLTDTIISRFVHTSQDISYYVAIRKG